MRALGKSILLLAVAAGFGLAQEWEFGVAGGMGLSRNTKVTTPAGPATLEFRKQPVFSTYFGQKQFRHIGGELRYSYMMTDIDLNAGGVQTRMPGATHQIHYDMLVHFYSDSRVQAFAAFGGGVRVLELDAPAAPNPTQGAFLFRAKHETIKPVASFGAGVKVKVAPHIGVRFDVRDYISPFPTEAVAAPGTVNFTNSVLHNIVPMAGLAIGF